ncbi:MAG: SRPBCC family protein [Candidatus Leucobacter sulfamidivorax]|nr:SRPBCC family protein [Candidatus Leucobacter sulfamidivorax]
MHTITNDIDLDLPIRTVYDQWTQFEDFPAFMSGVDEVQQLDDTTMHWKVHVGGVERGFDTEITEQLPDERIAWKSTSGPRHAGVVTFHRLNDEQTRVRLQLDWDPEGLVEKMGAALQLDDAQVASDLREFARLMETNGFATGAWRGTVERPSGPLE